MPTKKKPDGRQNNGALPKGSKKRSKLFSIAAMPEVVAWLDKQVRKMGLRSRADWLEAMWRKENPGG